MKSRDLTEQEQDFMWNTEPEVRKLETGITDGTFHSVLSLWYTHSATLVAGSGEAYNSEPWAFDARLTPEEVLKEYLEAIKEP